MMRTDDLGTADSFQKNRGLLKVTAGCVRPGGGGALQHPRCSTPFKTPPPVPRGAITMTLEDLPKGSFKGFKRLSCRQSVVP